MLRSFVDVTAPSTRILLAVSESGVDRFRRVLAGHDLVVIERLAEGRRLLDHEKFGMVIIDVHFDESQMFDLLHHVRVNRMERTVPVICVLGTGGRRSDVMTEGLDHAVKAMMANAFLDLVKFSDDEKGDGRLRRIVDYLILLDGDLHQGLESV